MPVMCILVINPFYNNLLHKFIYFNSEFTVLTFGGNVAYFTLLGHGRMMRGWD